MAKKKAKSATSKPAAKKTAQKATTTKKAAKKKPAAKKAPAKKKTPSKKAPSKKSAASKPAAAQSSAKQDVAGGLFNPVAESIPSTLKSASAKKSDARATLPAGKSRDEWIAERAYFRWQDAGCPHGDGTNFWADAEVEYRQKFE